MSKATISPVDIKVLLAGPELLCGVLKLGNKRRFTHRSCFGGLLIVDLIPIEAAFFPMKIFKELIDVHLLLLFDTLWGSVSLPSGVITLLLPHGKSWEISRSFT